MRKKHLESAAHDPAYGVPEQLCPRCTRLGERGLELPDECGACRRLNAVAVAEARNVCLCIAHVFYAAKGWDLSGVPDCPGCAVARLPRRPPLKSLLGGY